jgi:hypothetical protein
MPAKSSRKRTRPAKAGPSEESFRRSLGAEDRAIFDQLAAADPWPWLARLRSLNLRELENRLGWIERHLLTSGEDALVHQRLREADALAYRLQTASAVERDRKRQAGTRKPRRPKIDAWIHGQLLKDSSVKSPTLWQAAPDYITDVICYDRFSKRVTKARKELGIGR